MRKKRNRKSRSKHNIPFELWHEILSRVPVKSLLRCRCVSKPWKSMIDDPEFARSHIENFKNNAEETHYLVDQEKSTGRIDHRCIVRRRKGFTHCTELTVLDAREEHAQAHAQALTRRVYWTFLCALDGLVVLKTRTMKDLRGAYLTLWNPSIRRSRVLHRTTSRSYVELGLGFDPSIKDYKYIRFVVNRTVGVRCVKVYTVGSRSWRTIQYQDAQGTNWRWAPLENRGSGAWSRLYCKGALYFTAGINTNSDAQELVYFNLSTEVFGYTSLPVDTEDNYKHETLALLDNGSSLGALSLAGTRGSVWVMELVSGVITGWTKRYTFDCQMYPFENQWRYWMWIGRGEMLVQWNSMKVTSYNLETHEEKVLLVNGRRLEMRTARCYKESLLLLQG